MQPIPRLLILATLAIAALGCGEAAEGPGRSDTATASATVSATDSAGVEIVHISDLGALDLPELNMRLLYSTAADVELYHVVGAVFLPDSSLAVADRGSSEVLFLDQEGSVRERAGREGEGPGEYVNMAGIGVGADGNLAVFDDRLQRFTFLDTQGSVTGVQRVQLNEAYVPLVHLADGGFVAVLETRPFRPLGFQRGPLFLVVFDQAGEVADTLGRWAGKERRVTPDRMFPVGFGATTLYAGRGTHVVLATTDSVDITLYEASAPLARVRGGHVTREVTSEEKEAWTELYLEVYPEDVRPSFRPNLEQAGVRDTYPAIGALKVDADGAVWLGGYPRLDDVERSWTVFGPDAIPVGRLGLPVYRAELLRVRESGITGWAALELETSIPSASHELLDVAAGRIAVLRTSEMGEEFIEVYAVELPLEQDPPDAAVLDLGPCTERCGMTLVPVAEFGEAAGPGMIEGGGEIAFDRSGRLYIGAEDHVLVFDADGTFLRRIGRRGEGPGELMSNRAFAVVDDATFVILDSGRGVILRFDWTGQLLDEVRPQGWAPIGTGVGLVSMGGARAVYQAAFRGGDRGGYPLHLINLESGEIESSFGSETGEFDIDRERFLDVVPARGPGESIWMGRRRAYWIELWEPDNRLVLSMRRDIEWFPDALVDLKNAHGGPPRAPEPVLFSLAADDSLLWVMIGRADERWAEARDGDYQMEYDTFIEVIDWKRGRVIASRRFDEVYSAMIAPGVVGEIVITPEASVRFRTLRIELEAAGG